MNKYFTSVIFVLFFFSALAQEEKQKKKFSDVVKFRGYLKDMQTVSFLDDAESMSTGNLIHNRLNFKIYPIKNVALDVEFRNRIIYGEQVKAFPGYASYIAKDYGYVSLSKLWVNEKSLIIHSIIDRAWIGWENGKWEVRAGRQRINWGINLTWNPNDIFNTYNFLDFDYEERPGSDALKIRYATGTFSGIELAAKAAKNTDSLVIVAKYNFNKWKYDFQILGGIFNEDLVIGTGWAGNIKTAGFKGEVSYFHPRSNFSDTSGAVSVSATVDYSFKKGLYISGSYLYSSLGGNTFSPLLFLNRNISAKNLMPFKHSILLQAMKNITPLMNGGFTAIYSPKVNSVIFIPSLAYSISSNWSLDLLGQLFFAEQNNKFKTAGNSVFLRLKWSF
jgi:hypothetical protein